MRYLQISIPWMSSPQECKELQIACELVRSSRKTMAIQVKAEGKVIFRVPYRVPEAEVLRFAAQHRDWIGRQYRKAMEQTAAQPVYSAEEIRRYKEILRPVLQHRAAYYAGLLGVTYGRIAIRDQKTRWGSCSAKGGLNFNCLLMLTPPEVIDYVVVHELCHRKEMNHSPAFWAEVEKVLPNYKAAKKWLKDNGAELMSRMYT